MRVLFLLVVTSFLSHVSRAQSLAINTTGAVANSSSILDVSSTTKGMLIPRVALLAKNNAAPVSSPATSLLVYNTAIAGSGINQVTAGYYFWDGTQWTRVITDNKEVWSLNGNAGTNPLNHYIGTTDLTAFRIQTNSFPAMYFNANSNFIGIGDENPGENLVIKLNTRAVFPVPDNFSGIQIKPTSAALGSANNYGLHIGLDNTLQSTARITNYESGDLWLGFSNYDALHLKNGSRFIGINEDDPKDNLTITLNSAAVVSTPDNYSGILLHSPFQAGGGNDQGLHFGLDNTFMTTARLMNNESGDLFLGTNKIGMLNLKSSNRFIGINEDNPKDNLTITLNPAAVVSTPDNYSGILLHSPFQVGGGNNQGLHIGLDNSFMNTARVMNNESGDLFLGTNKIEMIHLKGSNRYVGVNTSNPYHSFSVMIATNAVFTTPYDGLSVMTPNNPANAASGLVVGSDPSNYFDKGVWNYDNGKIAFGTNNLEQVTITSAGDVGIGITGPSQKLHVIGNILASGTITPSDIRYKKNIQPIISPLLKLNQINGVTYQYRANEFPAMGFTEANQMGFIAQEVEKVFPELVFTDKQGYKAVDYPKIMPVLVEAIKDQQVQINELKQKLENLEKRVIKN